MSMGPQATLLPGDRLHLHHGPIDLIIGVEGPERRSCFRAATDRFQTVLQGLVSELADLRRPLIANSHFANPIADRMGRAVQPYHDVFVTPMAAVAGAVADEVLAAMLRHHEPPKAYVNNGGDIALHLTGRASFAVLGPAGEITVNTGDAVRGIATSGWRGRSHSRGIADAVTVLARSAAAADVAATLIANAVDLPGHPGVTRKPASELSPDSDLGNRLVTTDVAALSATDVHQALQNGRRLAEQLIKADQVLDVVISLQGQTETVQAPTLGAYTHA
ncbi:thiamine biosynthesis protein ApbE [Roseobacter cerasinus]|uniref:Thiamine biosynthesis protein ApbE n=2 Tax=Roseobacter cerasinus TaxID=2602289 RepID=A0A640VW18_9RHOB|nr:thiamine biosynthesis protein ApbE [Roseobacter cerasinus]